MVLGEFLPRHGDTHTESLHIPEILHCVGEVRIAVIGYSRLTKVLAVDLTKGAARVLNFNAVTEPSAPDRSVCALIRAMHHSVSCQLLKSDEWVVGAPNLNGLGGDIGGNRNVV